MEGKNGVKPEGGRKGMCGKSINIITPFSFFLSLLNKYI
jgi:hypothetical protein